MHEKAAIRVATKSACRGMESSERDAKSQVVASSVLGLAPWEKAGCVALYSSTLLEVGTQVLFEQARSAGKVVCFPRVELTGGELVFHRVDRSNELVKGAWDILEPTKQAPVCELSTIDLFIVPGVAFDLKRNRVGSGGGYYDRYFSRVTKNPMKIGLAFEMQVVSEISVDPWDVPVDLVVTESRQI